MSGLRSEAANSRKYDDAGGCSAAGKGTRQCGALGGNSTRPTGSTFDQLDVPLHYDLNDVLEAR